MAHYAVCKPFSSNADAVLAKDSADLRYDPLRTNRSFSMRMEFWRGTAGGYRSSIATSLLQRNGFQRVSELAGGVAGWEALDLPLTTAKPG